MHLSGPAPPISFTGWFRQEVDPCQRDLAWQASIKPSKGIGLSVAFGDFASYHAQAFGLINETAAINEDRNDVPI